MHREGHILELADPRRAADFEDRAAPFEMTGGNFMLDPVAGHQFRQAMIVEIGCGEGADIAPVAQHGHALGDFHDLIEPMADENDGHAEFLQAADVLEQQVDFLPGQRGGRLIHDEQAGIDGKAATDGDELALRNGQGADAHVERQAGADPIERRCRGSPHRPPGRGPQAAAELKIDRDVLENTEIWKERQVLEDDLNAQRLRLVRAEARMGNALDRDRSTGIGRMYTDDDLDEGGFARAVLADEAMDLAASQRPIDSVQRDGAAEPLSDTLQRQIGRTGRGRIGDGRHDDSHPDE